MESMRPVFDFLDYRDIMKEAYEERKQASPLFSYRVLAEILGIDSSNLFRILQGDAHIPLRCQPQVVEFLGISSRAAEYFLMLVAYGREKNERSRKEILEKAMALRDVARRQLVDQELAYYKDWWVVAIRSLLEVVEGRAHPAKLAERIAPRISKSDAENALALLLDLGLVKKASSGRLVLTDSHLTSGESERKIEAVRAFQKQILSLASESLDRFPRGERDVSTITFAVDEAAFTEIRAMLRECRRQIQKRIDESRKPDRVLQLAMALFPLAPQEAGKR